MNIGNSNKKHQEALNSKSQQEASNKDCFNLFGVVFIWFGNDSDWTSTQEMLLPTVYDQVEKPNEQGKCKDNFYLCSYNKEDTTGHMHNWQRKSLPKTRTGFLLRIKCTLCNWKVKNCSQRNYRFGSTFISKLFLKTHSYFQCVNLPASFERVLLGVSFWDKRGGGTRSLSSVTF